VPLNSFSTPGEELKRYNILSDAAGKALDTALRVNGLRVEESITMNKRNTQQNDAGSSGKPVSLSKLIDQQGVSPVDNLDEISDLWPVDDDPDLLLQHVLRDRIERRQFES